MSSAMWNSEVCTCTVYLYQEGNNTFFPLPLSISPFFASLFSIYQQCRMHRQTDIPARREDFFFLPLNEFLGLSDHPAWQRHYSSNTSILLSAIRSRLYLVLVVGVLAVGLLLRIHHWYVCIFGTTTAIVE